MSEIDPEKPIDPENLELKIHYAADAVARANGGLVMVRAQTAKALIEAARAHLSTLPRVKEVEVAQWVVVDLKGEVRGCWDHEHQARKSVGDDSRLSVVRLTGTAKVRA